MSLQTKSYYCTPLFYILLVLFSCPTLARSTTMCNHNNQDPSPFLKESLKLISPKGNAFDLACGYGRHAIYLAQHGFDVTAIDTSTKSIDQAKIYATKKNVTVKWVTADIEQYSLAKNSADLIIVTNYLDRDLFKKIKESLKPNGYVIIETFDRGFLKYRPNFPTKYTLNNNELLNVFSDFKIHRYQLVDNGQQVFASVLAQKTI